MKIKEMQNICDKAQKNNACINCPLFNKNVPEGCLKNYRYEVEERYRKAKAENNEVLSNKIIKDYQEIERRVLNTWTEYPLQ